MPPRLWMSVSPDLRLRSARQEAEQVAQWRNGAGFRIAIEHCGKSVKRPARHAIVHRLAASDPLGRIDRAHQNDFGMPSTCVATWLRIRLVEIGAT